MCLGVWFGFMGLHTYLASVFLCIQLIAEYIKYTILHFKFKISPKRFSLFLLCVYMHR